MKKLLVCILALVSVSAYSLERVACNVSASESVEKKSLNLVPVAEISYPSEALDFDSLEDKFTTKSIHVQTSAPRTRELQVSARISDDDKSRVLEFKVNQKKMNKFKELSRTYYRLGYEEISIRHEGINFGFIVPGTDIFLTFLCSKY